MPHFHPAVRPPAVAGAFYDGRPEVLRAQVDRFLSAPARPRQRARGVMVPHAGYIFSGAICGHALASVEIPATALILHTKHHPGGSALSLASFERWRTPLGDSELDPALFSALAAIPEISINDEPHHGEHAAEVVLPFLQRLRPGLRVAVLSVGHAPFAILERAGLGIAAALRGRDTLIVASSDMNHYEDHETTLQKDALALRELERGDARAMLEVCEREAISMCGAAATALMLIAARALGASRVELLEHDTSGPVSGDYRRTVGYASALIVETPMM
ncbi:MAG: AmmeMemoRadiSam system protein B [Myxococcales bacterium]|nr:AmmeMemoRadiSam system protein B [Myxococcales bacterium]